MTELEHVIVWPQPGQARLERCAPSPVRPGETLVDVLVSISNPGTERARLTERPNALIGFPHVPGTGAVGIVRDDSPAASAGDLVAVRAATHRSAVSAPTARLHAVAPFTDPVDAVFWPVALIAMHGLGLAGYEDGEAVTVVGAGLIGATARRVAIARGSQRCRVLATSTAKRWTVRDEPQTEFRLVAAPDGSSPFGGVTTQDGRRRPDGGEERTSLVVDATGTPTGLVAAIAAAADGGRIVLLGSPRAETGPVPVQDIHERGLRLVGAHIDTMADDGPYTAEFFDLLEQGRLRLADLVTMFTPAQASQLYQQLTEDRSLVAPAVDWSGPTTGTERSGSAGVTRVREPDRALRFGIVGCGDVGAQNAQAVRRAAGAALVACYDLNPELGRALADDLSARAAPDLNELLADPKVDAVVVATPHDTHEEIARAVVGAGRHLLLQKPLSVDFPSARRIAAITNSAPVTAGVLFPGRYTAAYRAARSARDQDVIGPIAGLVATYLVDKPPSYYRSGYSGRSNSEWRLSKVRSGGGVIIMNLLHHLDMAQSLLDAEAEWVFAHTLPSGHSDEIEDVAMLIVGYGPTVASFIGAASVPGGPGEHLRLWGRDGQCQILPSWQLTTTSPSTIDLRPEPEDPQAIAITRFVKAVRAGHPPDVTIDYALSLQGIVTAAYESAGTGRAVSLTDGPPPRYPGSA